ncbi:MAG: hypothetical protein ACK6D3_07245 [Planctomycetaceae bacterium]
MADIVNQILLNVDAGDASTKIGDIKRAIKELEGVALASGDANSEAFLKATQAAGQLRDRLEDVKDATKTFKGDPLEGLSKGLGSLKGRLADLDFQGFNDEVGRLKTLSKQVSFKDLSSSVGETGKSFASLGKILLTNPIFLIATAVTTIIANFDKLVNAGGLVGKIFGSIKDAIDGAINAITTFTDAIGLTSIKSQEEFDKTVEGRGEALDEIERQRRKAISDARANGKTEEEILAASNAANAKAEQDKRAEYQKTIDAGNKRIKELEEQYKKELLLYEAGLSLSKPTQQGLTEDELNKIKEANIALEELNIDANNAIGDANQKARNDEKANREKAADDAKRAAEKRKQELERAQAEELRSVKDNLAKQLLERKQFYDKETADLIAAKTKLGDFSDEAEQDIANKRKESSLKLLQDSLTILEKERIEVENNKKLSNKDRIALEQELANKILDTRNQITVGLRDIEKTNVEELQKDVEKAYAGIAAGITQETSQETLDLTKSTNEQLAALNEQYRNGEITSLEDYENKKSQIIEDEEDKRRQIELDAAQKRLTNIENEAKNALALLPEGSEEYKNAKAQYDAERIAQEQIVADKLREINQDLTDDQIAAEAKLLAEREKNRLAAISVAEKTFSDVSSLISDTSQGFENLGSDILQAASNIGGAVTTAVNTFTDKNADGFQKAIAGFQAASAAIGEISNVLSAQADRRLEEIEKTKEAEIQASEDSKDKQLTDLEDQLNRGVITKAQFDAKKIEIEQKIATEQFNINEKARKAEYDAKKKVFEQEKKVRIAQAISAGAQAAISAFASGAQVPLVGPITTGPAFAAIAAAFTAAQVALIASQKFEAFQAGTPPSFPSPSVSTPGGGGGGGGNDTFSPPQFFGLGQGIFQNQAAGQQTQQVVVLESDITRVQDRVRVIEDRSVIG